MVNPKKYEGFVANEHIFTENYFKDKADIMRWFDEVTYYECSKCYQDYEDEEEAKECCQEENN